MHKDNNLTFVRLFAALLVIYSHAFDFLDLPKPLFLGYHTLGPLGVWVFFAVSGYLVAQSWEHDPHMGRFLLRRALRIFPALAVCIALTVLLLGPAVTSLPLADYFQHPATTGYFTNVALYITYYLPGVFEQNRIPNAVNGSLWSLPAEFAMYLGLAIFSWGRKIRLGWWCIAGLLAALNLYWLPTASEMLVIYRTDMRQLVICGIYFWVGVLYQQYRVDRLFNMTSAMLAMLIWISLTRWPTAFVVGGWFLLPFIVLSFGLTTQSPLAKLTRFDYSYGVYIYAFPIQQTVVLFFPQLNVWTHTLVAIGLTLPLAAASWHFVEKTALRLKPKNPNTSSRLSTTAN